MKKIRLTQNRFALVDNIDFERTNKYKWNTYWCPNRSSFVVRRKQSNKTIYLSRFIMNAPDALTVDHINHDTLDNRRKNLRICTTAQNCQNRKIQTGSSQYKGVSWYKRYNKWQASIRINGKAKCLGYFEQELDAAKTYDIAAIKHFGKFAYLNLDKIIE